MTARERRAGGALGRVVRSGTGRRRVQTLVIVLATMASVASAILGGSLVEASGAPFDDAFARQHGAHLSAQFDADAATKGQLARTARADGVETASGPFRTVTATPTTAKGQELSTLSIVGRATPRGAVDALALTAGRWAERPGEIVLSADGGLFPDLGGRLTFTALPGSPALTIVGVARSATRTADAWVLPAALTAPTAGDPTAGYQMLYRLTAADTAARLTAGRAAIAAAVPRGALTGARSWLTVRADAERDTALFVPFLVAFGVLGLVMSVLIVGHVVTGAVGAGRRRVGILKAVGFTPGQVVRAYVAQASVPAAIGTALGVVAGHLLVIPVLSEAADAYGTTPSGVAPAVDAAVIAGTLGTVALTAWAGAWRAGRLRTVDALALGRGPGSARGRRAARLAARLPLPRPVGLGLARPFARPARAAAMAAAVLFGTAAVTFAVGLGSSLAEVSEARAHDAADVTIDPHAPPAGLPPGPDPRREARDRAAAEALAKADPAALRAAIARQPGTRAQYGQATGQATVAGISGATDVIAFDGDASWAGYAQVTGRWIRASGEAVVPTAFLTATGAAVGDTLTLDHGGTPVRIRIVGTILETHNDGMEVFTDLTTFTTAGVDLTPTSHFVALRPGTDRTAYLDALNADLAPLHLTADAPAPANGGDQAVALGSLTALLTALLVAVAALGVLNGVLLDTRERARETGIHKALGMTPRQTVVTVATSVVVTGLLGGALGVPLGVALHHVIVPAMGDSAGIGLPAAVMDVYAPAGLALLVLGGLLIAVLGALLPGVRTARGRTVVALRAE
ncbi:FtsX-like permease family protein [Streptomyces sp. NPDC046716]|uniref:ABC transporter permease n=1 Tax=Streptomyces sp. NPDC046716 TaxID=3157093 RepID=UPI0033D566F9